MSLKHGVKGHVRFSEHNRWQFRIPALPLWAKKTLLIVRNVFVVVALLSIAVQLIYPPDRALPFMKLSGIPIGTKDNKAVMQDLEYFREHGEVTLVSPSREWKAKWADIGISVDKDASTQVALEYEWWERLLPFSAVIKVVQSQNNSVIALVDEDRAKQFAEKLVMEDRQAAKEAVITVVDGRVVVDQAKEGYAYTVEDVQEQLRSAVVASNAQLHLSPRSVAFAHTQKEIDDVVSRLNAMLARTLVIRIQQKTLQPDRATVGGWLKVDEDEQKKLQIFARDDVVKTYIEEQSKEFAVAPGTATVTLLDGQEIGREAGKDGRGVDIASAVEKVKKLTMDTSTSPDVSLSVVSIPAALAHNRTYSKESSGLQALIRDWEASHYGDYGIIIRELGGQQRYAEYQPDKRFVTASTFKMFLAYIVFKKIEAGVIAPDQRTDMGWTVDECMREMIVNSTNPCSISLQNLVGWENMDPILHDAGFASTKLDNRGSGDKHTTVRDEANFLLRLYSGTLMSQEHHDYLLSLLKRQIWRAGIPSGVPKGTVVADKVGLYGSWVHDVAIVYGPKGNYILAIMSRGGSDPDFADLSRKVYNFFNQ